MRRENREVEEVIASHPPCSDGYKNNEQRESLVRRYVEMKAAGGKLAALKCGAVGRYLEHVIACDKQINKMENQQTIFIS